MLIFFTLLILNTGLDAQEINLPPPVPQLRPGHREEPGLQPHDVPRLQGPHLLEVHGHLHRRQRHLPAHRGVRDAGAGHGAGRIQHVKRGKESENEEIWMKSC